MKKLLLLALALTATLIVAASCGSDDDNGGLNEGNGDFSVGMVTDSAGVNDQSFNQSAWGGLQRLQASIGASVSYLESATMADKGPNMDIFLDMGKDIIWVIGWPGLDALIQQSMLNPDQVYGIIDHYFGDDIAPNVVAVDFLDNEATFLAGYLAARHSNTGVVGFIGGMDIPVIARFETGFVAGVAYANHAHGLDVEVLVQYIGDWEDTIAARAISMTMHASNADVLYAAAGGAGQGAIDFASENDIYVIGVDVDQSHLAPNHMITSTLKNVGEAMYDVSLRLSRGETVGGQNLVYNLAQGAVGITAFEGSTAQLVDRAHYDSTMALAARVISGEIQVPVLRGDLADFIASL
jgi:basic membrane protein A